MSNFANYINSTHMQTNTAIHRPFFEQPATSFTLVRDTATLPLKVGGAFTRPFVDRVTAGLENRVTDTATHISNIAAQPKPPYRAQLAFGTWTPELPNRPLAYTAQALSGALETPLAMAAPYAFMPLNSVAGTVLTAQKLVAPDSMTQFGQENTKTFLSDQVDQWKLPVLAHVPLRTIAGFGDVATAALHPFVTPLLEGFENLAVHMKTQGNQGAFNKTLHSPLNAMN